MKKNKLIYILSLIIIVIILVLFRMKTTTNTKIDKSKETIVTSIAPLNWLVSEIAGEKYNVIPILKEDVSHEGFEPDIKDIALLEDAKLFFYYDLFEFEEKLEKSIQNSEKKLNVLENIDPKLFLEDENHNDALSSKHKEDDHDHEEDHDHDHEEDHDHDHEEEHDHDHEEDHDHDHEKDHDHDHDHDHKGHHHHHNKNGYDPHVWFSIEISKISAKNILDKLVSTYPEDKENFEKNYEKLIETINKFDIESKEKLKQLGNTHFIIYHPALSYFLVNSEVEEIAIESEGKEPSVKEIQEIIEKAKDNNVKTIFVQPQFSKESAKAITNELKDAKLVEFNLDKSNVIENLNYFLDNLK